MPGPRHRISCESMKACLGSVLCVCRPATLQVHICACTCTCTCCQHACTGRPARERICLVVNDLPSAESKAPSQFGGVLLASVPAHTSPRTRATTHTLHSGVHRSLGALLRAGAFGLASSLHWLPFSRGVTCAAQSLSLSPAVSAVLARLCRSGRRTAVAGRCQGANCARRRSPTAPATHAGVPSARRSPGSDAPATRATTCTCAPLALPLLAAARHVVRALAACIATGRLPSCCAR